MTKMSFALYALTLAFSLNVTANTEVANTLAPSDLSCEANALLEGKVVRPLDYIFAEKNNPERGPAIEVHSTTWAGHRAVLKFELGGEFVTDKSLYTFTVNAMDALIEKTQLPEEIEPGVFRASMKIVDWLAFGKWRKKYDSEKNKIVYKFKTDIEFNTPEIDEIELICALKK